MSGGLLPRTGDDADTPAMRKRLLSLSKRAAILALVAAWFLALWQLFLASSEDIQRFYCFGPSVAPNQMSLKDQATWYSHLTTPVFFEHRDAIRIDSKKVTHVDLNNVRSTTNAARNGERILLATPLKNASARLSRYFELLSEITYPHELIDLAFIVSDSTDDTTAILASELERLQQKPGNAAFRHATVITKDFGFFLPEDDARRHSFEVQGPRRKIMGRARNYLLGAALGNEHSWVYWRDVDISDVAPTVIEDFIAHDKDILVPNVWFHWHSKGDEMEGRFDYNSWIESDKGRRTRARLHPDVVLAEGYKSHYDLGRRHMCLEGDWRKDKDVELPLDAIGGVNILVKADVHRSGINFPAYAFENQAETEGFARMAKRAGYQVVGLPNYVVWHVHTPKRKRNRWSSSSFPRREARFPAFQPRSGWKKKRDPRCATRWRRRKLS